MIRQQCCLACYGKSTPWDNSRGWRTWATQFIVRIQRTLRVPFGFRRLKSKRQHFQDSANQGKLPTAAIFQKLAAVTKIRVGFFSICDKSNRESASDLIFKVRSKFCWQTKRKKVHPTKELAIEFLKKTSPVSPPVPTSTYPHFHCCLLPSRNPWLSGEYFSWIGIPKEVSDAYENTTNDVTVFWITKTRTYIYMDIHLKLQNQPSFHILKTYLSRMPLYSLCSSYFSKVCNFVAVSVRIRWISKNYSFISSIRESLKINVFVMVKKYEKLESLVF